MRHLRMLLCLSALALLLTGCGTANMVKLTYKPVSEGGTCTSSVNVIKFVDARGTDEIGVKSDGTYFYSTTPVGEWVSKAFFEELKKVGCGMSWSEQDFGTDTDYKMTGTIKELWLKEMSLSEFQANMTVNVILTRAGKKVYEENLYANVNKTVMPSGDSTTEIMQEAMQDLIKTAMPTLMKRMGY